MKFGSLFSGIEGFGSGFEDAGMECAWQVEIDADCNRVLAHHYPSVLRHADVSKCGKHNLPWVPVICGGFPCQDISVAGKRAGLKGERSGLFFEFMRIVDELRPGVVVIENVPGLQSSPVGDAGRDFQALLQRVAEFGVYECGWTSLDAQWFGLAQRRRRLFFVLTHVDLGAGCAAEILSLVNRSKRHPEKGRKKKADVAGTVGSGVKGAGWRDGLDRAGAFVTDTAFCLAANGRHTGDGHGQGWNSNYVSATLRSRQHKEDAIVGVPFVVNSHNGCAKESHARETDLANVIDQTGGYSPGQGGTLVAHTLRSEGADASEDGTGRGVPLVTAFQERGRSDGHNLETQEDLAYSLNAPSGGGRRQEMDIHHGMTVRRLTPTECLRLQGFPDDWLDLDPPLSDSAKYRMIGNAVARPVAKWLGSRNRIVCKAKLPKRRPKSW